MPKITFNTFTVDAPRGWEDITDEVEADDPPFTLARQDGVGALQFSIALYEGGSIPNPKPSDLLEMVERFGASRDFGKPSEVVVESGELLLASGSFDLGEDSLRVWQVSDSRNFAFITYTCASEHAGIELPDCERIVRTIVFYPHDRS